MQVKKPSITKENGNKEHLDNSSTSVIDLHDTSVRERWQKNYLFSLYYISFWE